MINQWAQVAEISREAWQKKVEQEGWWLLLDAAINPEIVNLVSIPQSQSRLYWDEMGEIHASISPYLLPMCPIEWLDDNITHKPNWGMAVQLNEAFHKESLARQQEILLSHLRTWSLAKAPEQEVAIMRINDWSIFHVLWNATQVDRQPELKGPIQSLCYWDSESESVYFSLLEGEMRPDELVKTPIQLTDAQYAALSYWAHRHQYQKYREHLQHHHQDTRQWSEDDWRAFLSQQTQQANQYGFEQPNDIVRYLSLAIVFGENFTSTEWAQKMLSTTQSQGQHSRMDRLFAEALTKLDEEHPTS
ncbi:DUF4123 domain-containing protein [Vibrio metschnikovii]|uniref:DUF4123 domain-containing protein n=1 Tax=Vibrio metschnikovii TaxID=28172 RepID=UPI002FCB23EF